MRFLGSNATEMCWRLGLRSGLCWGSLQRYPTPLEGDAEGAERGKRDNEGGKRRWGGKGRKVSVISPSENSLKID